MAGRPCFEKQQSGFTHLGLVIIGLAVIVIGVAGWRVWEANHKDSTSSSELTMVQADGLEACRDEPLFDHIPMALEDFRAFRPLGFVSIPIHIFGAKHSNFAINLPDEHVSGLRWTSRAMRL